MYSVIEFEDTEALKDTEVLNSCWTVCWLCFAVWTLPEHNWV